VYNGTADIAKPMIFPTQEEMSTVWNNQPYNVDCSCGNDEDATIYADYGIGMEWEGRVCRGCGLILSAHRVPTEYRVDYDPYGWW